MARVDDDQIDRLVAQWRELRPDLEVGVMAEVARLLQAARLIGERLAASAAQHDLHVGDADVLLTLFRAGPPNRLSPTALAESTLVTTGTMTSRLDKLEARGLVRRIPNPADRRALDVELTRKGSALVDRVLPEHVANEERMFSGLNASERRQLDRLLRKLLGHLSA